jgi:hypothetical protein
VLGTVAVAGLTVGIAWYAAYKGNESDAQSERQSLSNCTRDATAPGCAALKQTIDAGQRNEVVSVIGFGLAGGALVGALGVLLFPEDKREVRSGSIRWSPSVGPGSASIAGTF